MKNKRTLVVGASLKPERYSYKVMQLLSNKKIEAVAYGLKPGKVADVVIDTDLKKYSNIDTVTLYVNPNRQVEFYDYIISLNPKRVIFNPGTENAELQELLSKNNITYEEACSLVLLSTGQY